MELLLLAVIAWLVWITVRVHQIQKQFDRQNSVTQEVGNAPARTGTDGFEARVATQQSTGDLVAPMPRQPGTPTYMPRSVESRSAVNNNGQFFAWLQKDLLMKFGALFLIIGVGWFLSYAFANDWIGPAGRILIGIMIGLVLMGIGIRRIRVYENQGAIFTVVGAVTVIGSISVGYHTYGFFDFPYLAVILMFFVSALVTLVSLKYQRNSLALTGLVLAYLSPYIIDINPSPQEHFIYLLAVTTGTLWVVYATGWRNLTLASSILFFLLTTQNMYGSDKYLSFLWVCIFVGIFFVANIVSLIRQRGGITSKTNLFTAFMTALTLFSWVFTVVPEELQSLTLVAWALVFGVGSYLVFRVTSIRSPFYVYAGTALAFIGLATIAELQHDHILLTIALTFETAVVVVVAQYTKMERGAIHALVFLFVFPILFSLESFGSMKWNTGVMHGDFFALLIVGLTLLIVGLYLYENEHTGSPNQSTGGGSVLMTIGAVYLLALVWLVVHALIIDDGTATSCTLIIYTLLGIFGYFNGKHTGNNGLRIGGGFLLGLVIMRLLFIDVWGFSMEGRIITFIVVGTLLLSTAFLTRKNKQSSLPTKNQ